MGNYLQVKETRKLPINEFPISKKTEDKTGVISSMGKTN
jgi:hypothetical protein